MTPVVLLFRDVTFSLWNFNFKYIDIVPANNIYYMKKHRDPGDKQADRKKQKKAAAETAAVMFALISEFFIGVRFKFSVKLML